MARTRPTILGRREVAASRLFRVEAVDLRFANGCETRFERLVGSGRGAVLVVPMPDPETILLVREYAAGTDRYELGFPKGRIEGEEPVLEAGNREIMEEVGFGAGRLEKLASLSLAPAYSSHLTHVVLATDLYPRRLPGDEPEPLEVVEWRLADVEGLLARDDVTEARTIAALFMVRERLAGRSG